METRITIQRPNGETEVVTRRGSILHPATRRQMEYATSQAGRGTIIGWEVVGELAPLDRCKLYSPDQGCPLHGEMCR